MATPPAGTVTFLFTDIESSTRLWENHPEQMRTALARHDMILRSAIEEHNGFIVKTTGDGFLAAFATAPEALAATIVAQQALSAENWLAPFAIRVRMGLHSGTAEYRDGDYFGQAVNRAARLMAAAYGGQILLTEATAGLCGDSLPTSMILIHLGEFRLKDLNRAENIYQLQHPALPSTFPLIKTLDQIRHNLPVQLTSFVGRTKEMEDIRELLTKTPLLTLTGTGGVGKTRLAQQVAAESLEDYPDGVWLVELSSLSSASLVTQAVAQTLGIREEPSRPLQETMVEQLRKKCLLLLLDNCEHLVDACARLSSTLLQSCPQVRILATSREILNVPGELSYRVPPLSVPSARERVPDASARLSESVQLFLERAQFHKPGFALTSQNESALTQLCYRLDGIPLAIELAAARIRSLTVEEINARVDNRFHLLVGGNRTLLPRQQTLRGLIDWSYDLLNERERTLLHRISLFSGGWTLAEAESVCGFTPLEDWGILDLLTELVNKSLVLAEETIAGTTRYRILETIRQYSMEKLSNTGEVSEVKNRHAGCFLIMAEEAELKLRGPEQGIWLNRLDAEHDNLRAALDWYIQSGVTENALRLCGSLCPFWAIRGYLAEGRDYLRRALEESPNARSVIIGKALAGAGRLAWEQGDFAAARSFLEQSADVFRETNDRRGMASSLLGIGRIADVQGDYDAATARYEESLATFHELGDSRSIAVALVNLGTVAYARGSYATARSYYERSLQNYQKIGDQRGASNVLLNLGLIAVDEADYESARSLFEQCLGICRALGDKQGIANALGNLGLVLIEQKDYTVAQSFLEESLALSRDSGNKRGIANALSDLAVIAMELGNLAGARSQVLTSLQIFCQISDRRGVAFGLDRLGYMIMASQPEQAVTMFGAAQALRLTIGLALSPVVQAIQETRIKQARSLLGDEAFTLAWHTGCLLEWDRVTDYIETWMPSHIPSASE